MPFHQHLSALAAMTMYKGWHFAVGEVPKGFVARGANRYRYDRPDVQCPCLVPLGVSERMKIRDIQCFQKFDGLAEMFVGFAGMSDDHIRTDRTMRHGFPDQAHPVCIQFPAIPAAHQAQHMVAAALQGEMKMGHKPVAARHPFDDLRRQQIGLDRGNPVSVDPDSAIQLLYEPKEGFSVVAKIPQVYPGQDNLPDI